MDQTKSPVCCPGHTLQILKHAGIDARLAQEALGDGIDAMVNHSRCEAQNPGVGQPHGGTQIAASCRREGALTTSRGITYCTHMVSQRCRERIIVRFPLTSTGRSPSMSRGGARAILARAWGESAPAAVRTPAFALTRLKRTTRANDVNAQEHIVSL
jgi:hypothetical protein